MGGPLLPCVYLAPLWRYGVSKVGRMLARTHGRSDDFILCSMLCIALDRQLLFGDTNSRLTVSYQVFARVDVLSCSFEHRRHGHVPTNQR